MQKKIFFVDRVDLSINARDSLRKLCLTLSCVLGYFFQEKLFNNYDCVEFV